MPDSNPCSDILKWGIWKTSSRLEREEFAEKTIDFFKTNKTYSKSATLNAAQKAKIALPDIPIPMNFDGTFGVSKSENYSDALVHYYLHDSEYKRLYIEKNVEADGKIVDAWVKCQKFRNENNPPITAELEYSKVIETDAEDQITIRLIANVYPDDHGKIIIKKDKLIRDLKKNGCKLKDETLDPLQNGSNNFIHISRSSAKRGAECSFTIRTNRLIYKSEVQLIPYFEERTPVVTKDQHLESIVHNQPLSNYYEVDIRNAKNKDVLLKIETQFDLYGFNEQIDLFLWIWREEGIGKPVRTIHIPHWTGGFIYPKLEYDNIPFHKNSIIHVKAGYDNWQGSGHGDPIFDTGSCNIRITAIY